MAEAHWVEFVPRSCIHVRNMPGSRVSALYALQNASTKLADMCFQDDGTASANMWVPAAAAGNWLAQISSFAENVKAELLDGQEDEGESEQTEEGYEEEEPVHCHCDETSEDSLQDRVHSRVSFVPVEDNVLEATALESSLLPSFQEEKLGPEEHLLEAAASSAFVKVDDGAPQRRGGVRGKLSRPRRKRAEDASEA